MAGKILILAKRASEIASSFNFRNNFSLWGNSWKKPEKSKEKI